MCLGPQDPAWVRNSVECLIPGGEAGYLNKGRGVCVLDSVTCWTPGHLFLVLCDLGRSKPLWRGLGVLLVGLVPISFGRYSEGAV